ncbi:myocardial zonula adherens protein [Alligator mississippiensis]|uniref:myocardial zonula adherens protein n=1 Tax=Alligator mississippiensis TaxID=8496 RepID=UPI0028778C54|nr:myocardial zonula adherens protein [Alligator mississippiensis]
MLRYSSGFSLTATATAPRPAPAGSGPGPGQRRGSVCRLRLTLPPDEGSLSDQGAKKTSNTKKQLYHVPNGLSSRNFSRGMVYGVVHRTDNNHKKEMVVYGWSADQLKEEMNYIKDVRATLEKVREQMYGEYDEMKRKIQQLTNELTVTSVQQESLESHMRVQAAALDSFSEMNSSLTSASIELQKTLVDVTLENTDIKDQIRNLKHTHEKSMEKLKDKQKQLETAQMENQLLKLQVESSQEANADVMREMTRKLYSQYEQKLKEEEQKHKAEREILIAETNRLLKAIEEANKKMQITEISIQEKDQRIGELDRFIQRMEEERHQLQKQLEQQEIQIAGAKSETCSDRERSQHLEEVAANLRERIKHLDDMVHCQQKKVKHMVEEIEMLRNKIQEKELFIVQLLEKISFLECENKELQDKLDYLMESRQKTSVETRETGVGCDFPLRKFINRLPDKGKKISDFAEKLKHVIAQEEEVMRTTKLLSTVRLEFQARREEINTSKLNENKLISEAFAAINENSSIDVNGSKVVLQNQEAELTRQRLADAASKDEKGHGKSDEIKSSVESPTKVPLGDEIRPQSSTANLLKTDQQTSPSSSMAGTEGAAEMPGNSGSALVDAFQSFTIVHEDNSEGTSEKEQHVSAVKENPFGSLHTRLPKKLHYIEILESRAKNPVAKKPKFKTNILLSELSGSSQGSSPDHSPGGLGSPISAEERRLRDKKHLNDVTAARLPPLHHEPTQLLSTEESISIQIKQKEVYEEMQAKLAAQKLAERLNIKMVKYEPEGEASKQYREVRDEEDCFSTED